MDHGDRNRLLSRPGVAALGAWLGASIGLVAIALAVRSGQAWVDSLPQRDTDMFGRPEGWLLALALVVGAPPTFLCSCVLGRLAVVERWPPDVPRSSSGRVAGMSAVFAVAALIVGALVDSGWLTLAWVSVAPAAAGYVTQLDAERRSGRSRPTPPAT